MIRFFLLTLLILPCSLFGQVLKPSSWEETISNPSPKSGDVVTLTFTATIDPDWYLYSSDFDPDCGPMVTTFLFTDNISYDLQGKIKAINPIEKYDEVFECDVSIFKKKGIFKQNVKILQPDAVIAGTYEFQVCSDVTGQCIPFENEFSFQLNGRKTEALPVKQPEPAESKGRNKLGDIIERSTTPPDVFNSAAADTTVTKDYGEITGPRMTDDLRMETAQDESIIVFMFLAFIGGLAALLTPCVFPMIPMTVTYFTGKGRSSHAFIYGFSIIFIYTVIGSIIAPLMGPETANHLSTEWLPNIIFFLVFVLFALSFFGLFDITLPSRFVNKMDQKSDRGGLAGVFFMAFTLVLVSFSCTGPIVGSILVGSAGGAFLKPILGMFAFSLAFAIPFTLFAIFPGWLNRLPKSGGWLNSVKVVLGFIELALAFKFLSIADQAFHWGILDRDVNIAIWVVIFTLMGFYLLGKIRLPHDSPIEIVSVQRLMLAIVTFSFVLYLIPGLWGAPLKALAGYLPPMYTHDFDLVSGNEADGKGQMCDEPKYGDFLHLPHGLVGYFDYEQAITCARSLNKPLFIDFTGHGCTNCREMEAVVWSNPEVLRMLREEYVILALYVDDKTVLPESMWYKSTYDDKIKKTIGKQNADLQIANLENNAQPFYVLVGNNEEVLVKPIAYQKNVNKFVNFLKRGITQFKENN